MSSHALAVKYKQACLAEIEAIKPGNVHVYADGHGMQVSDFVQSAEASATVIADANYQLGQRIYVSVERTWQAVNCNTNLGIILLCAPMIQSALNHTGKDFQLTLSQTIQQTSQQDAEWLFKAIRMASPAGLGKADQHDVNDQASVSLYEAMAASAPYDLIGQQYENGYAEVFNHGLPQFQESMHQWGSETWAVTATYLYWLSHYPDSHIVRKYGADKAHAVKEEAASHYASFIKHDNPRLSLKTLLSFDQTLKAQDINPGTSADLTVATVLLNALV